MWRNFCDLAENDGQRGKDFVRKSQRIQRPHQDGYKSCSSDQTGAAVLFVTYTFKLESGDNGQLRAR